MSSHSDVPRYLCPVCCMPMGITEYLVVKHINNKYYNAQLWMCKNLCNRFILITGEAKDVDKYKNKRFIFKRDSPFGIEYDFEDIDILI